MKSSSAQQHWSARAAHSTNFPQTPAATAALSVATRFHSPALLNHSVRAYLWGVTYAEASGIAADDPESHLLQVATGWDVAGLRPEEFPVAAWPEILARYPRLGFGDEFLACFEDQASRKPGSAAAGAIANNAAGRIKANPLDG